LLHLLTAAIGTTRTFADVRSMSAFEEILLQNDFERPSAQY